MEIILLILALLVVAAFVYSFVLHKKIANIKQVVTDLENLVKKPTPPTAPK